MTVRAATLTLWSACVGSAVLSASIQYATHSGGKAVPLFLQNLNQPLFIVCYAFALYYWLKIAADHPRGSTMRIAWLLLAWSSAISIVRHTFEWTGYLSGFNRTMLTTLASLRQIPTVLALVFLTAGLIAMWSSFSAIGLGVRFRRTDLLWVAVIVAFVPLTLSVRENLADARSAYPLIRHLQSASPILLAAPALVGIVLHRIRQEMGGGQLATSLRFMLAFLVVRLAVLLVGNLPIRDEFPSLLIATQAASWAAPWLFPIAAVKRWNLTVSADALAERYENNPEREIAVLLRGAQK